MRKPSHNRPRVSEATLRFFSAYTRLYLRRHFHSLRVVRGTVPRALDDVPLIVCLNHPSWWDPLIALELANSTFPRRTHYAPIDSSALARYRIFERLGFFGIEPNSVKGAAQFLSASRAVLFDPRSALWVTAEGTFSDVRTRPVRLRSGVGHLLHSLRSVAVVPLALEYTFWEERMPEALACWGPVMRVADGRDHKPADWTREIASGMEAALDRLAEHSRSRDKSAFDVLLRGSAGIGGIYDVWRRLKARLRRERFVAQHGTEEF
jgi:1-acyl-sn-glycerol-3-phosphate acyltransferase